MGSERPVVIAALMLASITLPCKERKRDQGANLHLEIPIMVIDVCPNQIAAREEDSREH